MTRYSVLALLLLASCQSGPPREAGNFRKPDLVQIVRLDPSIRLDIRYATTNNFMHRPVYRQAKAFLQRPAPRWLTSSLESACDAMPAARRATDATLATEPMSCRISETSPG